MGDYCPTVNIEGAYVQENGIIRLKDGKYIGRLDGVTFDEVKEREINAPKEEV
jgi:hypothetical protein